MKTGPHQAPCPGVTPYLCVAGAGDAIRFYREVFGAEEHVRLLDPDGRVVHAEISVGPARLVLREEDREAGLLGPKAIGGTPVTLEVRVEDADAVLTRAVAAGATPSCMPEDRRPLRCGGQFEDPFGHRWTVCALDRHVPVPGIRAVLAAVKGADRPPP
ncbi:MAG: VOC family protein [Acidimicrobiia bacterium]